MIQQLQKRKAEGNSGFTIIEVMIVLAIAGLIMLIIFLAVPALQRSSRNTQVRNTAANILGGVDEFENNNNGQPPTGVTIAADGTVTVSGGAGTSPSTIKVQGGYTAALGTAMPGTTGAFVVNIGHKCNNNAFDTTATPRAVSIGYLVETGGGTAQQCTES